MPGGVPPLPPYSTILASASMAYGHPMLTWKKVVSRLITQHGPWVGLLIVSTVLTVLPVRTPPLHNASIHKVPPWIPYCKSE